MMKRLDRRFQYKVRELYQASQDTFHLTGGCFDPDQESLLLESRNEAAVLALDGQRGVIPLKFGDRISFKRAPDLKIAASDRFSL